MAKPIKDRLMNEKKTSKFCDILGELGYYCTKQESSHMIFKAAGRPVLSIPDTREIAPGTRRNLVQLALGNEYYQK
jgi:predicted RNA binding protein YcfA (HicA-like mRNA interferase family)